LQETLGWHSKFIYKGFRFSRSGFRIK